MKEKIINISFLDNTIDRMFGEELGKQVYDLISDEVCLECMNVIVFPLHLKSISSAFVQGFIFQMHKKTGIENIYEHFQFRCENKRIEKKIEDCIMLEYISK